MSLLIFHWRRQARPKETFLHGDWVRQSIYCIISFTDNIFGGAGIIWLKTPDKVKSCLDVAEISWPSKMWASSYTLKVWNNLVYFFLNTMVRNTENLSDGGVKTDVLNLCGSWQIRISSDGGNGQLRTACVCIKSFPHYCRDVLSPPFSVVFKGKDPTADVAPSAWFHSVGQDPNSLRGGKILVG